jgi:PPOX class probable F420-dependent enzyme
MLVPRDFPHRMVPCTVQWMKSTQSPISAEVREFLQSMRVPCVISTLRPDGHPITSATWYGFLGDDVVVSTPAARNKARNVRHDPRISFIVDTKAMPYRGVAIEGSAEVLPDPDDTIIRAIVERYLGAEAARAMLARLDTRGERVILRIRAERVRPWAIEPAPAGTAAGGGTT